MSMSRTREIERVAAEFASIPFVSETVFPNPHFTKRGLEKEACDLLIVLRGEAIVVQMKNQEDPASRSAEKVASWVQKQAEAAYGQLRGAIRMMARESMWCVHPRRGRVDFAAAGFHVLHGLVLIESVGQRVELPPSLPLEVDGVPVTYIDTNDLLNIVQQLRSFPDVRSYLSRRTSLGDDVRRYVGGERAIFEHYCLADESFNHWTSYADALTASEADREKRAAAFLAKQERDRSATFVEYVADALATRLPNYKEGLDAATVALYDNDASRRRYLEMQEILCDLSRVGRRALGEAMLTTFPPPGVAASASFSCRAIWLDEKPAFLFLPAAASGLEREVVVRRTVASLQGALAHFSRPAGMAIVDRDGVSFDVILISSFTATESDREIGAELFGSLRVSHERRRSM
jgi:hypothetical protein